MPRNEILNIPGNTWTELTASNVSAITFQVQGSECLIAATTGAAPSGYDGLVYQKGFGEVSASLTELFPGVSGAVRVWCYSLPSSRVFVSHA